MALSRSQLRPLSRFLSAAPCRLMSNVPSGSTDSKSIVSKKNPLDSIIQYGPGGRSSVSGLTVTVFGSTGFLARYLVNRLGKQGTQVVIPYRGDELDYRHLKVMGDLGQIVPLFYSLKDYDSIVRAVKGSHIVFNLAGRDYETGNFSFEDVHVEGARRIAKACRETGVNKLIHVSALNASKSSPSAFLRSKYFGEEAVKSEFDRGTTIVRPSNIFGAEDRFLHRIAYLNMIPVFFGDPVLKNGQQSLQPVYVVDVAQGLINAARDPESASKTYEFVGPKRYTYEELIKYFGEVCHRHVNPFPYPEFVLKTYARLMELWPPAPVISRDEITRMTIDDVLTKGTLKLRDVGINPTNLESVILQIWRSYRPVNYLDEPVPESSPKL
jgi:NADH dehydrogenase (ubiquinone) 1 alpha subcomplex subunit 9